jgi:hypothetical protein
MIHRIHVHLAITAFAAVAITVWSTWLRAPAAAGAGPPDEKAGARSGFAIVGVSTCTSSACHNANGPRGSKGSEYSTWVMQDKHAKAYDALRDERSKVIEKNYKRIADIKDAHPEKDQTCLNCHATTTVSGSADMLLDGVGCESCHGPAQEWLGKHYLAEWKSKSTSEKERFGMYPTKDLVVRAQLCASCHVGTAGKDVDHDLIAAGHPRLYFEFGGYLAIVPKHWDERAEKKADPGFEARVWAIGQAASAKAAMDLLRSRAQENRPWPEFAEYDCFACHHDLKAKSWRQELGHATRLGALPWGTWYTPQLRPALSMQIAGDRLKDFNSLEELRKEMEKPLPDRVKVAQQSEAGARQLTEWLGTLNAGSYKDPTLLGRTLDRLANEEKRTRSSWDGAAQLYLGLAALYQARRDVDASYRNPQLKAALQEMVKQLDLGKGYASPHDFEPEKLPRIPR